MHRTLARDVYQTKFGALMDADKKAVHDFWEDSSCGENLYLPGYEREDFLKQSNTRYELEPQILDFVRFDNYQNCEILEIGVGLGADHQKFAEAGAIAHGIDLTKRSVFLTKKRFQVYGLKPRLQLADSENLPFSDESFDLVYSWGVLHHTPNPDRAVDEIYRVLKDNGTVKVMIYNKYSIVGYMLWFRYSLLQLRPWTSLLEIYNKYLESPGTKAYSIAEALEMFQKFRHVEVEISLSHADLLNSSAGQRHNSLLLSLARLLWPRRLIAKYFHNHGLFMTISCIK